MTDFIEVKGSLTRRNFMKSTLAAAAAMGVGAVVAGCAPAGNGSKKTADDAVDDATSGIDYENIYQDGVSLMPSWKAACPSQPSKFVDRKSVV